MNARFLMTILACFGLMAINVDAKPVYRMSFENPKDLAILQADREKQSPMSLIQDRAAVGKNALQIDCMLDGNYSIFRIPRDLPQGRLTLWFWDPIFDGNTIGCHFRPSVRVNCKTLDPEGKPKYVSVIFDTGREDPYWWIAYNDIGHSGLRTSMVRQSGWTRLDVINPGGSGPRSFILCINGRQAAVTQEKFVSIESLSVAAGWGTGRITIDEILYDDDPTSYQPNLIQQAVVADESGQVRVTAGQPVDVRLILSAAAQGKSGLLQWQDFRGKTVQTTSFTAPHAVSGSIVADVKIPAPPRSGIYRLVASIPTNDDTPTAAATLTRWVDLQYVMALHHTSPHARILFNDPWQWLAGDPNQGSSVPTDWSGSEPVQDAWYYAQGRWREKVHAGWYRRTVKIPTDWAGRRMLLEIDDPQTKATVFIAGKSVGEVTWPGGEMDLTAYLPSGKETELVIFCTDAADFGYRQILKTATQGKAKLPDWMEKLQARGLRGEVALRCEPMGSQLVGVFAHPSVTRKNLTLTFDANGLSAGQSYRIRGAVSAAGQVVKTFESALFQASSATGKTQVTIPWADPILWEIGQPYLYDIQAELLAADGKSLDTMSPQRFGFREITFDGRQIMFNGRPINLFMPPPVYAFQVDGLAGYLDSMNLTFLSSFHQNYYFDIGNGRSTRIVNHYRFGDEAGIGADLSISDVMVRKLLIQYNKVDLPEYWREYQRVLDYVVKRFRNHPSLFFWEHPIGGQMEMGGMFNPMLMDGVWMKDFQNKPVLAKLVEVERKALQMIHQADPSRQVISQDSGNFGDSIHITQYAGFMPIQEMIEANEVWLRDGTKPYIITEQDAPMNLNWTNSTRMRGAHTIDLVPYDAEWSAITLGDRAFHRDALENRVLDAFEKTFRTIHAKDPKTNRTYWPPAFPPFVLYNDTLQGIRNQVWNDRMREQWLNWRADGIGLLCSWNTAGKLNRLAQSQYYAPITAFIAGTPAKRTAKDHLFAPGQRLDRQIIVLNNTASEQKLQCRWTLKLHEKIVSEKSVEVTVPAGQSSIVPIQHTFAMEAGDKAGELTMVLIQNSKTIAEDHIDIDVLEPRACRTQATIALIDPERDSDAVLRRIGLKYQRVNFTADLSNYDMVIFGRRAFNYETKQSPQGIDLGKLLDAGKKIIILEQDEATLRERFRFRTEYVSPRNAFGRMGNSRLTDGLPDRTLAYWRGQATLTDGYAIAKNQDLMSLEHNGARWFYPWNDGTDHARPIKWGNTHNVATVVIIKPDIHAFKSLIDCEFGLNYAAVWELQQSKGRIVFSQMDCSGRTEVDPASDRFMSNLVQYADQIPVTIAKPAVYLGGPHGQEILKRLRLAFETIADISMLQPGQILVLGEMPVANLVSLKSALTNHVQSGGTLFSLIRSKQEMAGDWLPFPLTTLEQSVDSTTIDKPVEPMLAGLGNGDFYWKGKVSVLSIASVPDGAFRLPTGLLARIPFGQGQYIFCQIDPSIFDVESRFYLKESQQFSYRTLRTLLTNLGVASLSPAFLAQPISGEKSLLEIDLTTTSWQGCIAKGPNDPCPPAGDPRWQSIKVPGALEDQRPEWSNYDGFFWYRTTFMVEGKLPDKVSPRLVIGMIDDEDDTFLNGQKIGHIGRDTNHNDYFMALRQYSFSRNRLRPGVNELTILVNDLRGSGGILGGPVKISLVATDEEKRLRLAKTHYLFDMTKADDPYCYNGW